MQVAGIQGYPGTTYIMRFCFGGHSLQKRHRNANKAFLLFVLSYLQVDTFALRQPARLVKNRRPSFGCES